MHLTSCFIFISASTFRIGLYSCNPETILCRVCLNELLKSLGIYRAPPRSHLFAFSINKLLKKAKILV
uniref:Secreted protein n=1 Tax=Trichogramma kaykai TaxID=54128 RepID=A0ABD2WCZ2_9HYME